MKKMLMLQLAVGAAVLAGAPAAYAHFDPETVRVRVPFRFVVGDRVLPAGRYEIKSASNDRSVVCIESLDGRQVAVVNTFWGGRAVEGMKARLSFDVYGRDHFLSAIEVPGERDRRVDLPKKHVEQELARLAMQSYERGRHRSARRGASSRPSAGRVLK